MALPPMLVQGVLGGLEAAVNHALQLDPATQQRLAGLAGQVIAIEVAPPLLPPVTAFLQPHTAGVDLHGHFEGEPDCRISGSPGALLQLTLAENKQALLHDGSIQISGDTHLAQKLQSILADLELDWEAQLAQLMGDIPAHQLANQLRGLFGWGQKAATRMTMNVEEYLHEEIRVTPPQAEVEAFYAKVHDLQLATDRLEARINRLVSAKTETAEGFSSTAEGSLSKAEGSPETRPYGSI